VVVEHLYEGVFAGVCLGVTLPVRAGIRRVGIRRVGVVSSVEGSLQVAVVGRRTSWYDAAAWIHRVARSRSAADADAAGHRERVARGLPVLARSGTH